jgi:hypothetical protein
MTAHIQHKSATCSTCVEKSAQERLVATGYWPLKAISCRFRDGTLTLEGQVPSYFHKQMAQEAIRWVDSIRTVNNRIEVPA